MLLSLIRRIWGDSTSKARERVEKQNATHNTNQIACCYLRRHDPTTAAILKRCIDILRMMFK